MGYREDVKIDIYNLHREFAAQPDLYIKYAEKAADAVADMLRAEEHLKVVKIETKNEVDTVKARLDQEIRAEPKMFGFEGDKKPTEAAILSCIQTDREYLTEVKKAADKVSAASENYLRAVRNKELLEGVKIAFSHRKTALEYEAQLYMAGYFSDPKVPKPYTEGVEKEVRQKMQDHLNPPESGPQDRGEIRRRKRHGVE